MDTITWNARCCFCYHQIQRGKPSLIFATDSPELIGVAHSSCSAKKFKYERFQMCPPDYLSNDQVSFLLHFFPMLYKLPGGSESNTELRRCVASMIWDYPSSMTQSIKYLRDLRERNRDEPQQYQGDLEADFLNFLGQVQKAAKEKPANVEADFRKTN